LHPHCHLFHSGTRTHTAASSMKHPHPHCLFYSSTHIHSATSSIQAHTCRMLAHTHTHTHTYTTTHTDVQCNVTFTTDDFRHRCTLTWMLNSTMYIKISSMALKALFSNQTRTDIFACVRSSHMHTMPDASTATRAGHAGHTNNHTSTHHVQRINNHTCTHHAGRINSHTRRSCWTHQQPHKHTPCSTHQQPHKHTPCWTHPQPHVQVMLDTPTTTQAHHVQRINNHTCTHHVGHSRLLQSANDALGVHLDIKVAAALLILQHRVDLSTPPAHNLY